MKKRRARNLRRVLITCGQHRIVATAYGKTFPTYADIVLERENGCDAMRRTRWFLAPDTDLRAFLTDLGRELLRRSKR